MSEDFEMMDENQVNDLVKRFESMLNEGQQVYFDADEFDAIIDFYFDKQAAAKADTAIKTALQLFPSATSFKIRKARLLAFQKEYYEALELLNQIELIEVANEEVYTSKAEIYSLMNKHELAIQEYEKSLAFVDFPEEVFSNIAFEYESLNDYPNAIEYLKKALELNPESENMLHEVSFFFEISGKEEDGIIYLNEFLDNNPYSKVAWFNLGIFYNSLELFEKAIESYEFTLAIDEEYSAAYFNIANAYSGLELYEKAIQYYEETFRFELPEAISYFYIGESYESMENLEQAMFYYEKALETDEKLAEAWAGKGRLFIRQGNDKTAIKHYERAIGIMPFNGDFKYELAIVFMRNSKFNKSAALFREIVENDPQMIEAWINYSVCISLKDDVEKAIDIIEEGLKENKDNASLWYRLAGYLYKTGKVQQAYYYMETAMKLNFELHEELIDFLPELNRESRFIELLQYYKHSE
ncbi:MAG: tetratricopeptide repeat protein [Bacteroidales bacterium]|nr:tetratricopeptide repeat protein [Bacteroidales bacterium]